MSQSTTIMTNKITTPPTAPPDITPKLLPLADCEAGDIVATVAVLVLAGVVVVVVMLAMAFVQFIPVYPLLQTHSPGCVHLPLVGAIKRDDILLTVDSSISNLY